MIKNNCNHCNGKLTLLIRLKALWRLQVECPHCGNKLEFKGRYGFASLLIVLPFALLTAEAVGSVLGNWVSLYGLFLGIIGLDVFRYIFGKYV